MANSTPDLETGPEEDGLLVSSVSVPGALLTMQNKSGKVWAIPAEVVQDGYSPHQSPFEVKRFPGYNKDFEYEFHGPAVNNDYDDLPEMLNDDWVPVTREELGVPSTPSVAAAEYGAPLTTNHAVGKQVCIMKPKVLVERGRKAYARYADTIVNQMSPAADSAKGRLEGDNALVTERVASHTTFHEPK